MVNAEVFASLLQQAQQLQEVHSQFGGGVARGGAGDVNIPEPQPLFNTVSIAMLFILWVGGCVCVQAGVPGVQRQVSMLNPMHSW